MQAAAHLDNQSSLLSWLSLIRRSNGVVTLQAIVKSHTAAMKFHENMKFRQQFDELLYDKVRSHVSVYLQMVFCGQDSQFIF